MRVWRPNAKCAVWAGRAGDAVSVHGEWVAVLMFHLPDLPNVGYSTRRDREGSDAIMDFVRKTERNRVLLLQIVVDGSAKWRKMAGDIWRGSAIDREAVDEIYRYLTLMAAKPVHQRAMLDSMKNQARYQAAVKAAMPDIEAQLEQVKLIRKWQP